MAEQSSQAWASLIEQEKALTPDITIDNTLRVKLLDRCGMTCNFCHNEGTPVSSKVGFQALRVSIYADRNQIPFTQQDIQSADSESFVDLLQQVKDEGLGDELHWTGGEPTLSKDVVHMTEKAADIGYEVKMTSNGQSGDRQMRALAQAGLNGINFSIFGTTPEELAATQAEVFSGNTKLASIRLKKMQEAMAGAIDAGLSVKANIVITGRDDIERGNRLLDESDERVKVRFQADTSNREESLDAIYELMHGLEGVPISRSIVAGCSIDNFDYQLPNGRVVTFKQARQTRLAGVCDGCDVDARGECYEGYYGLRLYKAVDGKYWLSPCIQKMNTAANADNFFAEGGLGEKVKNYRELDYNTLIRKYSLGAK